MTSSQSSSDIFTDAEDDLNLDNIGENTLLNCHKYVGEKYKHIGSQPRQGSQQQKQTTVRNSTSKNNNNKSTKSGKNEDEDDHDSNSSLSSIQDMFGDTTLRNAQLQIGEKYAHIANKAPHRASIFPPKSAQSSSSSSVKKKNESKRTSTKKKKSNSKNKTVTNNNYDDDDSSSSDSTEDDNLRISNIGDETMQQHLQYIGEKYKHLARQPHSHVPPNAVEIGSSTNSDDDNDEDNDEIYISYMDEDLNEESLQKHQRRIAEKYKDVNTKPHVRRTSNATTTTTSNVTMKQPNDQQQQQRKISRNEKENESLQQFSRSSTQNKSDNISNTSKKQPPTYSKRESIIKPITQSQESTSSSGGSSSNKASNSNPNQPRKLTSRNIYISQQSTSSSGSTSTQQRPNENGQFNSTSEQSILMSTPMKQGMTLNINQSIGITPILKDDVLVSKRKSMVVSNDERKERSKVTSAPASLHTTKQNNTSRIWEESEQASSSKIQVPIGIDDTTSLMEATAVSKNVILETIQTEAVSSEDEQVEENNNPNRYYNDDERNQEQYEKVINVDKSIVSKRNPTQSFLSSSSSFLRPNIPSSRNNMDKEMRISTTNTSRPSSTSSIPEVNHKKRNTETWVSSQVETNSNQSTRNETLENINSTQRNIRLPSTKEKSQDSTEIEIPMPKQTSVVRRESTISSSSSSSPKVTSTQQENREVPITPSLSSTSHLTSNDEGNYIQSTDSSILISPFSPPYLPNSSIYEQKKRSIPTSYMPQGNEKTRNSSNVPIIPPRTSLGVGSSFPTTNKRRTKVFHNLHDGDESGMETERCQVSDVDDEDVNSIRNTFPSVLSHTRPSTTSNENITENNSEMNTVLQVKNSSHNKSQQMTRVSTILENEHHDKEQQQEQPLEPETVSKIDSTNVNKINKSNTLEQQQDIRKTLTKSNDSDCEEEQEQQGEVEMEMDDNESIGSNETLFVSRNTERLSMKKRNPFESSTTTSVLKSASVTVEENVNNTFNNLKESSEQLLLQDPTHLRKSKETSSSLRTSVEPQQNGNDDKRIKNINKGRDITQQFESSRSNNGETEGVFVQQNDTCDKSSLSRNATTTVNNKSHEYIGTSRNSRKSEKEKSILKSGLNESSLHTYVESESDDGDENYNESLRNDNPEKPMSSNSRILDNKSSFSHRKDTTTTTTNIELSTSVPTKRVSNSKNKEQIINDNSKVDKVEVAVKHRHQQDQSSNPSLILEKTKIVPSSTSVNVSALDTYIDSDLEEGEESIAISRQGVNDTIAKKMISNNEEEVKTPEINMTETNLKSRILENNFTFPKRHHSSDLNVLLVSPSASTDSVHSSYLQSKFHRNSNRGSTSGDNLSTACSEIINEVEEEKDLSQYDTNDEEEEEEEEGEKQIDIITSRSHFPNSSTFLKIKRESSSSKPSSIFASPDQTRSISSTPAKSDSDLRAKFLAAAIARAKTNPSTNLVEVQCDVLLNTECNLPKTRKLQSANIFPLVVLERVKVPPSIPSSHKNSSSQPQNVSQQLGESNYSIRNPSRSTSSSFYSKEWQKTFLRKKSSSENAKVTPSEIYGKIVSSQPSLASSFGSQNSQTGKMSQTSRISEPLVISNSIPEVEQENDDDEEVDKENTAEINFNDHLDKFNSPIKTRTLHSSHISRINQSQHRNSNSVPSMMSKDSEVISEDSLLKAVSRTSTRMTLNSTNNQPLVRSLQATSDSHLRIADKSAQSQYASVSTVENMDQSQPPSISMNKKSSSKNLSSLNITLGQNENISMCKSSKPQNDDNLDMDTDENVCLQSPAASDHSMTFHIPYVPERKEYDVISEHYDADDDENMDIHEESDKEEEEEKSQVQIQDEYESENELIQEPIEPSTSTAAISQSLDKSSSVQRSQLNLDQNKEISKSNNLQNRISKQIEDEAKDHEEEDAILESAHSPRINDDEEEDEQQNSSPKNHSSRRSASKSKSPNNIQSQQHQPSITVTTPRTSIPKRKYNRSNIDMKSVRETNQEDSESDHEEQQQQQTKSPPRKTPQTKTGGPRNRNEAGSSTSKNTAKPSSSRTAAKAKKTNRKKQDPKEKYWNNGNMISKDLLQQMLRAHNLKVTPSQFKNLLESMNSELEIMCDALMDQAGRGNGMFTFRQLEGALKSKNLIDESLGKNSLLIELANLLPASTFKAAKGLLIPKDGQRDTSDY